MFILKKYKFYAASLSRSFIITRPPKCKSEFAENNNKDNLTIRHHAHGNKQVVLLVAHFSSQSVAVLQNVNRINKLLKSSPCPLRLWPFFSPMTV